MQYRFQSFTLDSSKLSITFESGEVPLDSRTMALLTLLIEHFPNHLSQQQLLALIWPDTVVSNWSVSRLVSDTRKLFQKQGHDMAVIQTLHGRGYRLAPELHEQLQPQEPAPGGEPCPAPNKARKSRPLALGLTLALVLAGAALLWQQDVKKADESLVIGEHQDTIGRVLWVDDNPANNADERQHFEQQRIAVYEATSTEDALMLLSMYQYGAVISDMGRADDSLAGLKLLQLMREQGDKTPFFLYTIMPSEAQQDWVMEFGGQGVAVESQPLYDQVLPLFTPAQLLAQRQPGKDVND